MFAFTKKKNQNQASVRHLSMTIIWALPDLPLRWRFPPLDQAGIWNIHEYCNHQQKHWYGLLMSRIWQKAIKSRHRTCVLPVLQLCQRQHTWFKSSAVRTLLQRQLMSWSPESGVLRLGELGNKTGAAALENRLWTPIGVELDTSMCGLWTFQWEYSFWLLDGAMARFVFMISVDS